MLCPLMLQQLGEGAEADVFSDDPPGQDANGAAILWMIWPLRLRPKAVQHKAEVTDFARTLEPPGRVAFPPTAVLRAPAQRQQVAVFGACAGPDLIVAILTLDGAETLAAGIATLVR